MEYSIRKLADLAGISTRTLRYYDQIGLLTPSRVNEGGYRFYGEKEVDLLQQILFYRERGLDLDTIRAIVHKKDFCVLDALEEHLSALFREQERLSSLIRTVKLTIAAMKGENEMDDAMKFEAFKKKAVKENEKTYGTEIRKKYGDKAMDETNKKVLGLSKADYERFQNLGQEIFCQLKEAVANNEKPESDAGKRIVLLHKEWLGYTWKEYCAQAHAGLADVYEMDERYRAYYDREQEGCAQFLVQAVRYWVSKI